MIRAFIAVEIDSKTVENIASCIGQLRVRLPGVRWTPIGNLHLTLKFLGAIDEGKVNAIGQALRQHLQPFSRFAISAKGLGVFPNPKRPRVLWVGLQSTELATLASAIDRSLEPLGFLPEKRPFQPHLTIGRWREGDQQGSKIDKELGNWTNHQFGESEVKVVILFQSMLRPQGAIHQPLAEVPLNSGRLD